ncbi:MAG: sulfatase-like hydrolase/transferase, partial [Candidatus Aminicenantes bacterium]|nr:sulfatase-like hydrolase/transferase [Candidatus Aminicenantes bacterium]
GPYHGRKPWYKKPENRKKEPLRAYESEISYVDSYIRKAYEEFGWDKNTVIVVTADHGEGLWNHGRQGHGYSLYREEIQVPLIIHYPGGAEGKRINPNVSTIDVLPTLRDIIGLQESESDEGWSLLPLIQGEEEKFKDRYLFSYLWKKIDVLKINKAVIYKKFHFHNKIPRKKELFNLVLDKMEKKNLFFKMFKIGREMEKEFEKFFSTCKKYEKKSVNYKLNKERLEKLKTLGYVQE